MDELNERRSSHKYDDSEVKYEYSMIYGIIRLEMIATVRY